MLQQPPRPKLILPRTTEDTILEALGALMLAGSLAAIVIVWPTLPARVPQHFDFAGNVDKWGDKSLFVLLPIILTVIYVGLTVLARIPHLFNYPVVITEENAAREYRLGISLLRWLKVEIVAIFALLETATVSVAFGRSNSMNSYALIGMIVVIFGTIGLHLNAMVRGRSTPTKQGESDQLI